MRPPHSLCCFFRVGLYACGRTLYRILHRYAALADFAGLLLPAAVNLNVLPGNIACVVTRKKAYQVCIFHIAAILKAQYFETASTGAIQRRYLQGYQYCRMLHRHFRSSVLHCFHGLCRICRLKHHLYTPPALLSVLQAFKNLSLQVLISRCFAPF